MYRFFSFIALSAIVSGTVAGATTAAELPGECFMIKVVDDQTGRGVPLVELRTTSNVRYYTDSQGIIAFCEPGLMNQQVYFEVFSHGYECPIIEGLEVLIR